MADYPKHSKANRGKWTKINGKLTIIGKNVVTIEPGTDRQGDKVYTVVVVRKITGESVEGSFKSFYQEKEAKAYGAKQANPR